MIQFTIRTSVSPQVEDSGLVGLHALSVHHGLHGLAAVERATQVAPRLADTLQALPGVRGVVTVATCNRVEVYVDATPDMPSETLDRAVAALLQGDGPELTAAQQPLAVHRQHEALTHLFRVAAGLDSMVVGEREIAGQLRRALGAAQEAGTTTHALTESFERALRCSRRIAQLPELAAAGRSIVAASLDLADVAPDERVLLLGTGAYAGATVAALRRRGITDIRCYSPTGRAATFAASHDCVALPVRGLEDAVSDAGLIISCRGGGVPLLTRELVADAAPAPGLTIIDLALTHDVDPGVAELAGITLIDLERIQAEVSPLASEQLRQAHALVRDGVAEVENLLVGRQMDPAVIALADAMRAIVDDEIARLPADGTVDVAAAAHALRRLAARVIHAPRVRAREAALQGRAQDFLTGLHVIYGIDAEIDGSYLDLDPATLDGGRCPATGLELNDLSSAQEETP